MHAALIPADISSVLDVGCGTAAWTLAFAAAHPTCRVIGTDLVPPEIPSAPLNCTFVAANADEPWNLAGSPFDFINARLLILGIRNWPRFYAQCWANLSPGGQLEVGDVAVPVVISASGSTTVTSPFLRWLELWQRGLAAAGMDMSQSTRHTTDLEAQGFVIIEERIVNWPVGIWQTTARAKEIGVLALENLRRVPLAPPSLNAVASMIGKEEDAKIIAAIKDLEDNWLERRLSMRM